MDDGLREAEAEALAAEVARVTGWTTRVECDAGSFSVTVDTTNDEGDETWSLYDWFDWGAWQPRIGRVPGWPEPDPGARDWEREATANPWTAFDEALGHDPISGTGLRAVLAALDVSTLGDPGDRAELGVAAFCVLAEIGEASLEEARQRCLEIGQEGRLGWPGYYLAVAAIAHDNGNLALEAVRHVPDGFFDYPETRWRAVALEQIAAEALVLLDRPEELRVLVQSLNRKYRHGEAEAESDDWLPLEQPSALVHRLIDFELVVPLALLLDGLDLPSWVPEDSLARVRQMLPAPHDASRHVRARELLDELSAPDPYPEGAPSELQDDWIIWTEAVSCYAGMLHAVAAGGRTDPQHLDRGRALRSEAKTSAHRWPERWDKLAKADALLDTSRHAVEDR